MTDSERAFYVELGQRLRSRREKAELTQAEVAARVGLTRTSITNVELGEQPVSAFLLVRLAQIMGCQLQDLTPALSDGPEPDLIPSDVPPKTADVLRRLVSADRP